MATRKSTAAAKRRPSSKRPATAVAYDKEWDVTADSSKSVKKRIAALTGLGWQVSGDKQRFRALLGIVKASEEPLELRLAALSVVQSVTFDVKAFASLRPDYLTALRKVSEDPASDPELRQRALGMLAREHDPVTQEVLLKGLRDPKQALVPPEKALQLLSYDVHAQAYAVARELLEAAPSAIVRREALRLLAADAGSAKMFERLLKDKSEPAEIRQLSASALHSLDPKRLQACAREITLDESESPEIKTTSLTALTHFGDDASIDKDEVLKTYVGTLDNKAQPASLALAAQQFVGKRRR